MNVSLRTLAGIAALTLPVVSNAVPVRFDGSFYEPFLAPGIEWEAANALANSLAFRGEMGHLATITTSAEDRFLHDLHRTVSEGEFWVGSIRDCSVDGACIWRWLNDEGAFPSSNDGPGFANWFSGEPNGDGTHSTVGRFDPLIGWNDEGDLSFIRGYIVEWEVTAVPEPSSCSVMLLLTAGLIMLGRLVSRGESGKLRVQTRSR